MRALVAALLLLTLCGDTQAQAQRSGSQDWPGKVQVGFHPFGLQTGFNAASISGYKLALDVSGLIKRFDKISLWVGGGFNYGAGTFNCFGGTKGGAATCGHDVTISLFTMLTLERLLKIPLVPFVRAGVASDIFVYSGSTAGGAGLRLGAGLHYYVLRNLGLGLETNFTLGGAGGSVLLSGLYGTWDFGLGVIATF